MKTGQLRVRIRRVEIEEDVRRVLSTPCLTKVFFRTNLGMLQHTHLIEHIAE